ncbi:Octamer-binding transcription factor [Parasponia andersonii]|uniref:Octamer-binding transcription factor n=1 Tax=Parasponia andersonii TaxID=3476 RepID=A0A2P5BTX8_PARAD|nr:Octamer-binding transcription factor [Parasponia andersonii]
MNDRKLDYQERLNPNNGLISDFSLDFGSRSSPFFSNNMGVWAPHIQSSPAIDDDVYYSRSHHQNAVVPMKPSSPSSLASSTIMSRFESPVSAFSFTEQIMGFPQYDSRVGFSSLGSQSQLGSAAHESYGDDSAHEQEQQRQDHPQPQPNFELRTSLPPMAKSLLSNANVLGSNGPFGHEHKLHVNSFTSVRNLPVYCSPYKSPFTELRFRSEMEKQCPRYSSGNGCISPVNSVSNGPVISSKTRIRWTQDLHEKFVECVNRLGGAEKATPKAILKLMDSDGLTIFHVKSHLQKYRIAKYLPESAEGKSDKRNSISATTQFEATTGSQIKEAWQLQLDVQRRLHEQLEIQRNLQLQIEEQGKQLQMMLDMQQRTSNSLFKSPSSDITSPDDAPSNSIDEVQLSIAEASQNTHFPSNSKIS